MTPIQILEKRVTLIEARMEGVWAFQQLVTDVLENLRNQINLIAGQVGLKKQ